MQFSFNPNASSFAPRGQQGSSQADQDGWAGSQRQHKPKPGVDLNAFPSINGKGAGITLCVPSLVSDSALAISAARACACSQNTSEHSFSAV